MTTHIGDRPVQDSVGSHSSSGASGNSWLCRTSQDELEITLSDCKIRLTLPRLRCLATLGTGILDNDILSGHSRFPGESKAVRSEIQEYLIASEWSNTGYRNPKVFDPKAGRKKDVKKTDAVANTLVEAAFGEFKGITLLHGMRKITTGTYNYDEFFGDRDTHWKIGPNLGSRFAEHGLGYQYVPLPSVGAPKELLDPTVDWEEFKLRYCEYVSGDALAELMCWVLRSLLREHLPVIVCCEPYLESFDSGKLTDAERNEYFCHRFLLAKMIADSLLSIGLSLELQHLNPNFAWLALDEK